MLEAMSQGLLQLLSPYHFGMLFVGTVLGLLIGVIPGVGGLFALAILLPFVFHFDATGAVALLIGAVATTNTSDSITSILLAVPGTAGAVPTIIDGYPMARKGEAGRALSAAFFASLAGGLIGAILLAASIPISEPLLTQFGSPEFFMLCILGVSMTAVLTGRDTLKGLIVGMLGLLLAAIGMAPVVPFSRYDFGIMYLADGIPLVVVALGFFGIPEIIDLMIGGKPISLTSTSRGGFLTGIKDVVQEKWLTLRCSFIGTYIGFLPGLGPSVASWLAYGHSVQSAKDKSGFGKGDVRGVIGPECANNAARGGALIPTLLFGVPGSPSMALFIVGLMVFGIFPGPDMLTKNLDVTFSIVWSLALANILGSVICMLLSRQLARIATIPISYLAPFVLMIIMIGAYQRSQNWLDLVFLLGFGIIGWLMKRFEYPRPVLLIGLVLGGFIERYLWLSVQRFGASWLLHPWVVAFGLATVASLYLGIRWQRRRAGKETAVGGTA